MADAGRPKIVLVGGRGYNVPRELGERFEILIHLEQRTGRVDNLPSSADYIFVIAEYASHSLVDAVQGQLDIPLVRLGKGWSSMKAELQRRCILPPEPAPEAEKTVPPASSSTGLSEDELWKIYKDRILEAAKAALMPGETVSEDDLVEALSDLVGVPGAEIRPLLWRVHMGGTLIETDGRWKLAVGDDGYENAPAAEPKPRPTRRMREAEDRALKLPGLRMGPYPTVAALIREMLKYAEFRHPDGTPLTIESCRKIVKRGVELHLVDDTHASIYVDHKPEVVLKRVAPEDPVEPEPLAQPPPSPEGALEKMVDQIQLQKSQGITSEKASEIWKVVIEDVKRQNKLVGTVLESSRIEWLQSSAILCCLVPTEFSMYMRKMESTETWGLVSSMARDRFGSAVVVRFVLDNAASQRV